MWTQYQRYIAARRRREKLIKELGGECAHCATRKQPLHLHHIRKESRTWRAERMNCMQRIKHYEADAQDGLLELRCIRCHARLHPPTAGTNEVRENEELPE